MDASTSLNGYRIPVWLLALYALMLFACGWFSSGLWATFSLRQHPVARPPLQHVPSEHHAVVARIKTRPAVVDPEAACSETVMQPLRYSAHVWADNAAQRSVTLNGTRYHEGDSLLCGEEIAEIRPQGVRLVYYGQTLQLQAMQDWPGGKIASMVVSQEDVLW